jgi:hypothetical protein
MASSHIVRTVTSVMESDFCLVQKKALISPTMLSKELKSVKYLLMKFNGFLVTVTVTILKATADK